MKQRKRIAAILLLALLCSLLTCCKKQDEPDDLPEDKAELRCYFLVLPCGDWEAESYGIRVNRADRAVIGLVDDCATVATDRYGEYALNRSVVKSVLRSESDDGILTYTFDIFKGLMYNDGTPVTAGDFLCWTLYELSPAGRAAGCVRDLSFIVGAEDYSAGRTDCLRGIRLNSDTSFTVSVKASDASGNRVLSTYFELKYFLFRAHKTSYWFGEGWSVKDTFEGARLQHESETLDGEAVAKKVEAARRAGAGRVAAGPYNLVKYSTDASTGVYSARFEINDYYCSDFRGTSPSIRSIEFICGSPGSMEQAMSEADMVPGIENGEILTEARKLIGSGSFDGYVQSYDRAGYGYALFVCDYGPTMFQGFRQALCCLIDASSYGSRFTMGWNSDVYGPYSSALRPYADCSEWLETNLDHYGYDPERAVQLLKEAGFVLNADGSDYVDGSGEIRYRKCTTEEVGDAEDDCIWVRRGEWLMPASVRRASADWSATDDPYGLFPSADVLSSVGVSVTVEKVDWADYLGYAFRSDTYGTGKKYGPRYHMFTFVYGWNDGVYDYSSAFTSDRNLFPQGYNLNRFYDETLQDLSHSMMYEVPAGDYSVFQSQWQQFVLRWNETAPSLPLYCNRYGAVCPSFLRDYEETAFWGFERAILYASIDR